MTSREDVDTPPPTHNGGELAAMSGGERTSREVVQMSPSPQNSSERAKQGGGHGGGERTSREVVQMSPTPQNSSERAKQGGGNGGGEVRYIPLHVIELILIKLPDKSLARCKCVSKGWLTTVATNPKLSHRSTRISPLALAVEHTGRMIDLHAYSVDARRKLISWEDVPRPNDSDSVCSVYSGIGCITTEEQIYVLDMIKGESYGLHTPGNVSSMDKKCTVIGRNGLTNEIIVVVFCRGSVQQCNLQLSTWTHISSRSAFVPYGRGIHIGGAFYWIVVEEIRATKKLLGSLNLETKSFSTIPLPPAHQLGEDYIVYMNENLALVRISYGRPLHSLGIWKLKGSQWVQLLFKNMDLDTTMVPVFVWGRKMIVESRVRGEQGYWLCSIDLSTLALTALYRLGAQCSVLAMDANTLSPTLLQHGGEHT